jgi:hypothetical protein
MAWEYCNSKIRRWILGVPNPPSKKAKNSLAPETREDIIVLGNNNITNEVKQLWHKGYYHSSTKKRNKQRG